MNEWTKKKFAFQQCIVSKAKNCACFDSYVPFVFRSSFWLRTIQNFTRIHFQHSWTVSFIIFSTASSHLILKRVNFSFVSLKLKPKPKPCIEYSVNEKKEMKITFVWTNAWAFCFSQVLRQFFFAGLCKMLAKFHWDKERIYYSHNFNWCSNWVYGNISVKYNMPRFPLKSIFSFILWLPNHRW